MRRVVVLLLTAALALTACEGRTGAGRPGGTGKGAKPPAKVDGIPTRAGTHLLELDVGGPVSRKYRLHVPPRLAEGTWRDGRPAKALPLVPAMHGTADRNVPYGGGRRDFNDARPFPPVSHTVASWRKVNGLPPLRRTLTVGDGPDCRTTGRGEAGTEVALCRIEGGGHRWPDGAENTLWAFFADHPRHD
jgi:poly(3-hydroxybutyrate) depolymerase